MKYEKNRVRWGVVWRMKASEYEPDPQARVYIRDLADRESAKHYLDECRRNPRCAAAAVARFTETCEIEEVFPGWGELTKGY